MTVVCTGVDWFSSGSGSNAPFSTKLSGRRHVRQPRRHGFASPSHAVTMQRHLTDAVLLYERRLPFTHRRRQYSRTMMSIEAILPPTPACPGTTGQRWWATTRNGRY